jgi:hypothetical protein
MAAMTEAEKKHRKWLRQSQALDLREGRNKAGGQRIQ